MALIEQYGNAIRVEESAIRRLERANRSGCDRLRDWCQLNDAIAEALARRKSEADSPARAGLEKSAQALVLQYPVQFATDVKRIERDLAAAEHGLRKPTVSEKLRASVTVAYQSKNWPNRSAYKSCWIRNWLGSGPKASPQALPRAYGCTASRI